MKSVSQIKAESKIQTILRRRERSEQQRIENQIRKDRQQTQQRKLNRRKGVRSPASFIADNLAVSKSAKALLVRLKKPRPDIPSDGRVIFVVKIHSSVNSDNKIKKAIRQLGLTQKLTGVFRRCDQQTHQRLVIAEPYITFGYPSMGVLQKLIRKRAKILVRGNQVPLKDNQIVEQAFGDIGVICIEDIIHELVEPGESFDNLSGFLCPFRMNSPDFTFKKTPYRRGGDFGNRERDIDRIITAMTQVIYGQNECFIL